METTDSKPGARAEKRVWHSPKVEELGNLRDFVQTGQAIGKSDGPPDGQSMAGNESMS